MRDGAVTWLAAAGAFGRREPYVSGREAVVDVTAVFAATLADEWARNGVTDAVVAPGSRSTPVALALAGHTGLRLHVVLDERSAAFRALGLALATGRPAVVLCTSGTAAANLHPAVVEAHHARVPLIAVTADRPPELRDTGAGQTIDQAHLFGTATRWFCDPGSPDDRPGAGPFWRSLAARVVAEALGPPAGPVHLNLPFREPLVTAAPAEAAPGRAGGQPWTRSHPAVRQPDPCDVDRLVAAVRARERGIVVAGWGSGVTPDVAVRFAAAAGWPVLADAISGLRVGPHAVSTYEAMLRAPGFADAHRPEIVLRIGAPVTSKVANAWLAGLGSREAPVPQVLVDPDGVWLDPDRTATERVAVGAGPLLAAVTDALLEEPRPCSAPAARTPSWAASWAEAERRARDAIDAVLDAGGDAPLEAQVARDLAAALPDGSDLFVASSLPVRALEWAMAPRHGLRVLANRGANGIDGFVSTVLGAASAGEAAGPTVALLGDLCFLHDVNGLRAVAPPVDAVLVVLDNDGGGIFSYLPQRDLLDEARFETLFATPHGLDLVEVARAHGASATRVDRAGALPEALAKAITEGGVQVLVVPVDRTTSPARHRALWDAVAAEDLPL